MRHTLEQYRSFPVLAWVIILMFVVATFYVAFKLQTETSEMNAHRADILKALDQDLRQGVIEY